MQPRLKGFPQLTADGYQAMLGVEAFVKSGLPQVTLDLIKIRVSQINGCGFCLDMHTHDAKKIGETDERLFTVAAWREAPFFTPGERAALALAEAATRIADGAGGVPDEVWAEAAEHYDEKALATLVMAIAQINAWNRIGVTIRTVAGSYR